MGSESFTYEEKRALGYGTIRERLGKARFADVLLRIADIFLHVFWKRRIGTCKIKHTLLKDLF